MNKELFGQSIKKAKEERLSIEEKMAIRQSVLNFVSQTPLRPDIKLNFSYGHNMFLSRLSFSSMMTILFFVLVAVGGGVSLGAEKSLPGDILYPVKLGVNEEIRTLLSVSEESKADWEVKQAERRLREVEDLAQKGDFKLEIREKIEANFDAHTEKVKGRIDKFESKENFKAAVEISSKFEASLKAHQEILDRLNIEAGDNIEKSVNPIEVKVRLEADNLKKIRQRIEIRADKGEHRNKSGDSERDEAGIRED